MLVEYIISKLCDVPVIYCSIKDPPYLKQNILKGLSITVIDRESNSHELKQCQYRQ